MKKEGKARKVIKARELWTAILESQIETGTPYMLYKDACNENQIRKPWNDTKFKSLH